MASGTKLSVTPPPPPAMRKQASGKRLGMPATSPGVSGSPAPLAARPESSLDADWDDEKEDDVTDVYSEMVTLVFQKDGMSEDESTHEIPRPTLRRLPSPPSAPASSSAPPLPLVRAVATPGPAAPVPLPPLGFDTLSASLAAASLPPTDFAAALARANALRTLPPRLSLPSSRFAVGLTAGALVALIAFGHKPARGAIVVDATDTRGAALDRFEILVDGEKTPCNAAPCSVPGGRGLHEVKVIADGFDVPATQAVAIGSGNPAAAHFIVARSSEPALAPISAPISALPEAVKAPVSTEVATPDPGAGSKATAITPEPPAAPVAVAPVHTPRPAAPSFPASPAAAAPLAKPSPTRTVASGAADAYLNINSIPASTCFLDGKSLGSTPRLHVEVSAGSHTVKFRAPDGGSSKTVVVSVGAGETRLAVARLK